MTVAFPAVPLTGREQSLEELTRPDERMLNYRGLSAEMLQAPYFLTESGLPAKVPAQLRQRMIVTRQLAIHGFFVYEFHAISMFWAVSCIEMALKMKFEESQPDPITLTRKAGDGTEVTEQIPFRKVEEYLQQRRREKWRIPNLKDFDYSFKALLAWAFRSGVLPEDIPIPVEELIRAYNTRFMMEIFPERARKEGLFKTKPVTQEDVESCWRKLSPQQQKQLQATSATLLVEELPRFRNRMAHPEQFELIVFPSAPVGTYRLLVEIVSRLWPAAALHNDLTQP